MLRATQPSATCSSRRVAPDSLASGRTWRRIASSAGECSRGTRMRRYIGSETHVKVCTSSQPLNSAISPATPRSEEHTSELQSLAYLVCRLLLEKKKNNNNKQNRCRKYT